VQAKLPQQLPNRQLFGQLSVVLAKQRGTTNRERLIHPDNFEKALQ
jgi:hypothetical protein